MSGMLSLSTLLTASACLSYVALIYLVLSGGGTRQVKLLFTAYLVGIFAMQAGLFLVTISTDPGKVKIFYDTTAAGFVFFVGLFYSIVVYFTGSKIRKSFLVLSLSFTVVAAGVCLSGACFSGTIHGEQRVPCSEYQVFRPYFSLPCFVFVDFGYAKTRTAVFSNRFCVPEKTG